MKKLLLIPLLALAACAPNVSSTPVAICPDGGVISNTVMDEKAYAAALIAYNVPAQAYKTANERGQLSPELKAKVRPLLIQMYDALKVLKSALAAGNTSDFQCQLGALYRASSDAKLLLGVR